jgi:hypothetical protein
LIISLLFSKNIDFIDLQALLTSKPQKLLKKVTPRIEPGRQIETN